MTPQIYNPESVELLSGHFPKRNESSYAWGRVNGILQNIPYCRGAWNFAVRTPTIIADISGLSKSLTIGAATYTTLPYGELAQYLVCPGAGAGPYRADEADLDLTLSMQMGCWVWLNAVAVNQNIMAKWTSAGNQQAYLLYFNAAANRLVFAISNTGADLFTVPSTIPVVANTWYYVVGQYDSAVRSLKIFVNSTLDTNAVGIPAAIKDSNSRFEFAATEGGTAGFLTGRIAYPWLGQYNSTQTFLQALYDHQRPLFGL